MSGPVYLRALSPAYAMGVKSPKGRLCVLFLSDDLDKCKELVLEYIEEYAEHQWEESQEYEEWRRVSKYKRYNGKVVGVFHTYNCESVRRAAQ